MARNGKKKKERKKDGDCERAFKAKKKGGLAGWQTVRCAGLGGLSLPGRKYLGFIGFI